MDTLCSAPLFTAFLVCVGGLILATIFSGKEDQPPLRLISKTELDKLVALTFSRHHNMPTEDAFTRTRSCGDGDLWRGKEFPGSNRALRRYGWDELSASCDAAYATKFAGAENCIRLF